MWPFRRLTTRAPILRTPVREARYTVFDLELTGLDERRDSIVSIGAIRMHGSRIELSETFYREVRPSADLTSASILVHGLTPDELAARSSAREALAAFGPFCAGTTLVGHFVGIDLAFLAKELQLAHEPPILLPVLDTSLLFGWLQQRGGLGQNPAGGLAREKRLYPIAQVFGIDCRGAHNALADAFITAQVFQRLIHLGIPRSLTEVGDLQRIADPDGRDRFRSSLTHHSH